MDLTISFMNHYEGHTYNSQADTNNKLSKWSVELVQCVIVRSELMFS